MEIRVVSGATRVDGLAGTTVARLQVPDAAALDEAVCKAVLEAVLEQLARSPLDSDDPPREWTFVLAEGDVPVLDEHGFYRQAVAFPALHDTIHALVRATATGAHGHRPWADAETPTGGAGASALAQRSRRWIAAYLQYLRECDLNHEVTQADELDAIVQPHGWNEDTITLVVARLTHCGGQHGEEQVQQWQEERALGDYLGTGEGRTAFLAEARRALVVPPRGYGTRDRATGAYIWTEEGREAQLAVFAPYLADDDLDALRRHVQSSTGAGT